MTDAAKLQKRIRDALQECREIDDLKRLLTVLAHNLGVVSSALYLREIPSEVLDERIRKSMQEGIEKYWDSIVDSDPLDTISCNGNSESKISRVSRAEVLTVS